MSQNTRFSSDSMPLHVRRKLPPGDPLYLPGVSASTVTAALNALPGQKQVKPSRAQKSPLAVKFETMWAQMEGPTYVTELRFDPVRRFRFDYAWIAVKCALEIQGGIFRMGVGGHGAADRMQADCIKLNLATKHGWRLFKLATGQITAENLQLIIAALLRLESAAPEWKAESERMFRHAGDNELQTPEGSSDRPG